MKVLLIAIALILSTALTGCTSRTEFGPCVGIVDDKDPKLIYKLSITNTVLAIFFSETIVVPVVVIANELQCPVGTK